MNELLDFTESSFSKIKERYNLIIEEIEGSLCTHIYNDYVHIYVRTEMYNRDKFHLTIKVIRDKIIYFFTIFKLYHYMGVNVPRDYDCKNGFSNNVNLLDKHFFWLLNGEDSEFSRLALFGNKHSFLFREQYGDRTYYKNKQITDEYEVKWVSEMEHWVRHKYNLMLDMYLQEANNNNVLAYFPLNDFYKIKPLLIEQLFINNWDNPTWDVNWGNTDYSWVKRLVDKTVNGILYNK